MVLKLVIETPWPECTGLCNFRGGGRGRPWCNPKCRVAADAEWAFFNKAYLLPGSGKAVQGALQLANSKKVTMTHFWFVNTKLGDHWSLAAGKLLKKSPPVPAKTWSWGLHCCLPVPLPTLTNGLKLPLSLRTTGLRYTVGKQEIKLLRLAKDSYFAAAYSHHCNLPLQGLWRKST